MNQNSGNMNGRTYRKPVRFFEDCGSVNPEMSYYVQLENVVNSDKQDLKTMVDRGRYFSMFAPRQSGKTTFIQELCIQLEQDPTYVAIQLNFLDYKSLDKINFYSLIEENLYMQLINRLREIHCEKAEAVNQFLENHHIKNHISFRMFFNHLNRILQFKKIVIFISNSNFEKNSGEHIGSPLHKLNGNQSNFSDGPRIFIP